MRIRRSQRQLIIDIRKLTRKFNKAGRQIAILTTHIYGLQERYVCAYFRGQNRFRYNINGYIATYEGVKRMYLLYARHKQEEISKLQYQLMVLRRRQQLSGQEH